MMPHYHLNVHNAHGDAVDEGGATYRDLAAARSEAIRGIRSFLSAELMEGVVDLNGHLDITDESGAVLMSVRFEEAVEVRAA